MAPAQDARCRTLEGDKPRRAAVYRRVQPPGGSIRLPARIKALKWSEESRPSGRRSEQPQEGISSERRVAGSGVPSSEG